MAQQDLQADVCRSRHPVTSTRTFRSLASVEQPVWGVWPASLQGHRHLELSNSCPLEDGGHVDFLQLSPHAGEATCACLPAAFPSASAHTWPAGAPVGALCRTLLWAVALACRFLCRLSKPRASWRPRGRAVPCISRPATMQMSRKGGLGRGPNGRNPPECSLPGGLSLEPRIPSLRGEVPRSDNNGV